MFNFKKETKITITDLDEVSELPESHKRFLLQQWISKINDVTTLTSVVYHCLNKLAGNKDVLKEISKQANLKKNFKNIE